MAYAIAIAAFVCWGLVFAAGCCKGMNDKLNGKG